MGGEFVSGRVLSFCKVTFSRSSAVARVIVVLAQFSALVMLQLSGTIALLRPIRALFPKSWLHQTWSYGLAAHTAGFLVALALMSVLKPFFPGTFGLSLPKGRSFVWPALWIGTLGGLLMLGVDHYPELLMRRAPIGPYSTNPANMIPWLLIQGGVVGLTEELVFRSLFLGYLITRIPTRVHLGSIDISVAGISIALLFSLAHASAFWHVPLIAALGQQIYAIGFGLLCAYLFEQSGSIVAPIVAHSAGDLVEWSCRFALTALLT